MFHARRGGDLRPLGQRGRQSHKQSKSANAVVEHNLFEKANGDAEAISVKSSDNTVRYNTIRDSRGFLVLRHGNRTVVEGNLLFGSGSEADSGPTSKEHDRPDRVTVAFNTVLGTSAVIDSDGGAFKPKDCVVANNIVKGTSGKLVDMTSGATVRYEGNILWGASAGIPSGYRAVDPKLVQDPAGLHRLSTGSPAIDTSAGSHPYVTTDFDPHPRTGRLDIGADEFGGPAVRRALTKADVGPTAP